MTSLILPVLELPNARGTRHRHRIACMQQTCCCVCNPNHKWRSYVSPRNYVCNKPNTAAGRTTCPCSTALPPAIPRWNCGQVLYGITRRHRTWREAVSCQEPTGEFSFARIFTRAVLTSPPTRSGPTAQRPDSGDSADTTVDLHEKYSVLEAEYWYIGTSREEHHPLSATERMPFAIHMCTHKYKPMGLQLLLSTPYQPSAPAGTGRIFIIVQVINILYCTHTATHSRHHCGETDVSNQVMLVSLFTLPPPSMSRWGHFHSKNGEPSSQWHRHLPTLMRNKVLHSRRPLCLL